MMPITAHQIHWIAGLIEGEGTFNKTTTHRGRNRASIRIAVSMTDRDVIYRLANLLGFGSICTIKPTIRRGYGSHGQLQHRWECSGTSAAGLMMTVLSLMGKRRAQRITELLTYWKQSRVQRRSVRLRKVFV